MLFLPSLSADADDRVDRCPLTRQSRDDDTFVGIPTFLTVDSFAIAPRKCLFEEDDDEEDDESNCK